MRMSDQKFIKDFESCAILKSEWTHRSHIKMAYIYLNIFTLDESIEKVRHGLKNLNKAHGTSDSQFHETLTVASCKIINSVIRFSEPSLDSEDFCSRNPHLLVWNSIYFFYSPDLLKSKDSRINFIEPDRTDFPS